MESESDRFGNRESIQPRIVEKDGSDITFQIDNIEEHKSQNRMVLEVERQRNTRAYVDSMWQGPE